MADGENELSRKCRMNACLRISISIWSSSAHSSVWNTAPYLEINRLSVIPRIWKPNARGVSERLLQLRLKRFQFGTLALGDHLCITKNEQPPQL